MRTPEALLALIDEGVVDEVLRPLMSGKEAQVYLVRASGELRVAKVYKDAQQRSFKQRSDYTEGRAVRNSRDRRAIGKRTRYGREQDEAAWRSAEVDMIYRLSAAGVRVPTPYHFIEGVLVMELVIDADGNPAPRLGDLELDPASAIQLFERVMAEVVRMLAAGVIHGDLSDFNVLVGSDGPVIIDFPQAFEAANNQSARRILLRDVDNLHRFIAKFVPGRRPPPFAQEMWSLYERGELTRDTKLKGRFSAPTKLIETSDVLGLIADADDDERRRRQAQRLPMKGGGLGGERGNAQGDARGQTAGRAQGSGVANGRNSSRPLSSGGRNAPRMPQVEYVRRQPPSPHTESTSKQAPRRSMEPATKVKRPAVAGVTERSVVAGVTERSAVGPKGTVSDSVKRRRRRRSRSKAESTIPKRET
jgi:RIO kinase 1